MAGMDYRKEALQIEGRLIMAGHTMREALENAGVDRISWWKWKHAKVIPRPDRWEALKAVAEDMIAEPNLDIPPKPSERRA